LLNYAQVFGAIKLSIMLAPELIEDLAKHPSVNIANRQPQDWNEKLPMRLADLCALFTISVNSVFIRNNRVCPTVFFGDSSKSALAA
jgi:hypothetical protein